MTLYAGKKNQRKLLTRLRLSVADWAVSHCFSKGNIETDSDFNEHKEELCDQYSLCALVSWLAKKTGLLQSRQSTEEENGEAAKRDAAEAEATTVAGADLMKLRIESSVYIAEEARSEGDDSRRSGSQPDSSRRSDYKRYQNIENGIEEAFIEEAEYPFVDRLTLEEICSLRSIASQILDNRLEPSVALLGALYEISMQKPRRTSSLQSGKSMMGVSEPHEDNAHRRLNGQFYTPPHVVDYCLKQALKTESIHLIERIQNTFYPLLVEDILNNSHKDSCFKICDPSCGTGNFLVGILKWLKTGRLAPAQMLAFLSSSVFGLELDGRAAALARCSLVLAALDELRIVSPNNLCETARKLLKRLRENISVIDTLLVSAANYKIERHFDLVITNPPYVSYGARNQPKVMPSLSKFLKLEYKASAEYKIRIHSIFQECALRLAKPGGQVVMLVPDAFLTGQYYQGLRREIVRQARIVSISELPDDTIPDATVGQWCVAVYQKNSRERNHTPDYHVDLYSISNWSKESSLKQYKLPLSAFISKDRSRFRLMFNDLDRSIATRLDRLMPLSNYLRGHTGIRATNGQQRIISNSQLGSTWRRGINSGGQIVRHKTNWSDTWINIDPNNLYGGGFDANIVENPKLLIRQTGDRIIAAYDEEGFYHLNNVHSFSTNGVNGFASDGGIGGGIKPDLFYLDGLMNSNTWLYLYQMKTRESGRALAQIDIESVESLPVPPYNQDLETQIAELVRRYTALAVLKQDTGVETTCHMIDGLIDHLVYKLYDFTEEEIQHIENYCLNGKPEKREVHCS